MPRKCRDYFTAAEIARVFDVPADKCQGRFNFVILATAKLIVCTSFRSYLPSV